MDLDETEKLFPGVRDKITAPKKISAYAKERQAAEAKRKEDEAANAALLKDFEASFDAGDNRDSSYGSSRGRSATSGPRGGFQDRHNASSDYGSLGPGPRGGFQDRYTARNGPSNIPAQEAGPPNLKRKRALEEMKARERDAEALQREEADKMHQKSSQQQPQLVQREPEESLGPKPMMYMSSLPPGITVEHLKAIVSPLLNVHAIRIMPGATQPGRKKSVSATATLARDTTIKQIDDAVNQLSDRYVGCGYLMIASRLPIKSTLHPSLSGAGDQPFGALRPQPRATLRNAPPPDEPGRFAPPDSYDRRGPAIREVEVDLDKCLELPTIRAIHTIADRLLSEADPSRALEIEASLMSLSEVQTDERFSFLFDSKSLAGVYYRYCLWKPDGRPPQSSETIFDDVRTKWRPPTKRMPYSGLSHLSHAVQDIDYVSSDEESDDEGRQIPPHEQALIDAEAKASITPLQRARLAHLLARMPTAVARVRRGDIARVTNFAISHAADAIEDIVDMLLLNVEMPFSLSEAAMYESAQTMDRNEDDDEEYDPEAPLPTVEATRAEDKSDPSSAKLVALYIISDILNAIASAEGAKNAWKFRQLFEQGLKAQKIFEQLGTLDREYNWGKMKTEQWKRKIAGLLDMWEKSSAFGTDVVQALSKAFNQDTDQPDQPKEAEQLDQARKVPKWMTTIKRDEFSGDSGDQRAPALLDPESIVPPKHRKAARDFVLTDGASDEKAAESVAEGEVQEASTTTAQPFVQNEPMKDEVLEDEIMKDDTTNTQPAAPSGPPRKRMRAEDMFADSDED